MFAAWLEAAPAERIVGIAGNHDFLAIRDPEVLYGLPWTYLQDESVEIDGLVVYGSPWTLPFFDWAFMLTEEQLAEKWALVPERCDVLVTHGPPYGICDMVDPSNPFLGPTRDPHKGSTSLRTLVERHPGLRLHAFGHIHESRGSELLRRDGLAPLVCVNGSRVDGSYQPVHAPITIDL